MRSGRSRRWHLFGRRPVAVTALVAYLIAVVGVPVPASLRKQRDEAYPCQHHACGCMSASECWDHCCCYSHAEKLAWARKHNVEPPAKVVVAAALEADDDDHAHGASRSCCAEHTACDEHPREAHPAAACHDHTACASHADADEDAASPLVAAIKTPQCRGLGELWCISGAVTPPPAAVDWQFQWDVVDWLRPTATLHCLSESSPPIRPPRV
jgi:hypothetical protein